MASSSNTPPPSDATTSYTAMSVGEVEAIGAHCQMPYCRQLDFLPFRCESCKGKFCLDHRTEDAHSCANRGAWAKARRERLIGTPSSGPSQPKPSILTHESQCADPSCKTLVNTPLNPGVHCPLCDRDYCLKHRLKEDHDCDKLVRQRKANNTGVADALGKLRAWGAARKASTQGPAPAANITAPLKRSETAGSAASLSKLQRIVSPFTAARSAKKSAASAPSQLNTLKRAAKGDAKVPLASRLYVHLEAVAEGEGHAGAKVPRADAFFNQDWVVGRVLDAAAKQLSVTNVNNRGGGEEEKLRVFHVDGGRLLPFGEKVGGKVKNGDTLVLLRGVGDAEAAAA